MIFPILKDLTTGNLIEITNDPFTIGRGLTSNYVIEDKIISRTHCSLNKRGDEWTLQDSSTNGIFVNDNYFHFQTTPVLKHNDRICLGTLNYTYQFLLYLEDLPRLNDDTFSINDISDDLLSQLADNMLKNIDKSEIEMETKVTSVTNIEANTNIDSNLYFSNVMGSSNKGDSNVDVRNVEQTVISPYNPNKKLKVLPNRDKNDISYVQGKNRNKNQLFSHEIPSTSSKETSNAEIGIKSIISLPNPANVENITTESLINSDNENTNSKKDQVNSQCSNQNSQPQVSHSSTFKQNQFEEMEDELLCTICANLFIKPVTLACSHTFCQYCIETWKKKKSECPICRKKITSSARTLVLDNVIEKMLENASQELRDQRKIMQEERQKLEYKKKNSKQSQKGNKSQRVMMYNTRLSSRADTDSSVIEIQDSSESSSSDTSNYNSSNSEFDYDSDFDLSENVMIGLPDAYYGGYGRCYSCGERGHWANGCPFR